MPEIQTKTTKTSTFLGLLLFWGDFEFACSTHILYIYIYTQLIFIWTGQLRANSKSPQNKSKLKNLEVLVVFVCISGILALCGCVVPPPPPPRHGRGRGGGGCVIASFLPIQMSKLHKKYPILANSGLIYSFLWLFSSQNTTTSTIHLPDTTRPKSMNFCM